MAAKSAPKLRESLTPGRVLIILSGPHRGKRVVYLGPHTPPAAEPQKTYKKSGPSGVSQRVYSGAKGLKKAAKSASNAAPLLLVTGPYRVNRVPLRRVNPRYVIATSVSVDLEHALDKTTLDSVLTLPNSYFSLSKKEKLARMKSAGKNKTEDEDIFIKQGNSADYTGKSQPGVLNEEKKAFQTQLDTGLIKQLKSDGMMYAYMKSLFGLRSNLYPHAMKF